MLAMDALELDAGVDHLGDSVPPEARHDASATRSPVLELSEGVLLRELNKAHSAFQAFKGKTLGRIATGHWSVRETCFVFLFLVARRVVTDARGGVSETVLANSYTKGIPPNLFLVTLNTRERHWTKETNE